MTLSNQSDFWNVNLPLFTGVSPFSYRFWFCSHGYTILSVPTKTNKGNLICLQNPSNTAEREVITLYMCAVPWGCSVPWGYHEYCGGYLEYFGGVQYSGGYPEYRGGVQYRGDIMSTVGVILSTVGCSVPWGIS